MTRLGIAPARGIGAVLLALAALSPIARADDFATTGKRTWIGVSTRALAKAWDLSSHYSGGGLKVVDVTPGGPADKAGIEQGDILVSIASHPLRAPEDLAALESTLEPDRPVEVVLARGGRTVMTFSMRPGPLPGTSAAEVAAASAGASATPVSGTPAGAVVSAGTGAASDSSMSGGTAGTGAGAGTVVAAGAGAVAGGIAAGGGGGAPGTTAPVTASSPADAAAAGPAASGAAAGTTAGTGTVAAAGQGAAAGAAAITGAVVGIAAAGAGPSAEPTVPSQSGAATAESVPVPVPATSAADSSAAATPPDSASVTVGDVRGKGAAGLGVRCENLSLDLANALGLKPGQGVLVLAVTSPSPADRAGIRPGDVISRVGGQPVVDVDGLDKTLATATSPLPIVAVRRGTSRTVSVEFPEPAADMSAAGPLSTDQLLASLRDEVRSLRDEVRKLREELVNRAGGPHP